MNNIPEGFELLGTIGYKDCGDYDASATYNQMYVVRHEGNLYVALKDDLIDVTPSDDGINWRLFLEGFPNPATGEDVEVTDTYGLTETTQKPDGGGTKKSLLQPLLDAIAKIAVKAVTSETFQNALKKYTVNGGTANVEGLVLDARQGNDSIDGTLAKRVKTNEESITELNSKTLSGYVVGADYDDTMQIDDTTWYYKDERCNLPIAKICLA